MIKPIGLTSFSVLNRVQNVPKAPKTQEYSSIEFNSKNYSNAIKSLAMSQISFGSIGIDIVKDKGQFEEVKEKAKVAKNISEEAYEKMSAKTRQIQQDAEIFLKLYHSMDDSAPIEFMNCDENGTRQGSIDFVKDENGRVVTIREIDSHNAIRELNLKTSDGVDYEPDTFVEYLEDGAKNIAKFKDGKIKEYQDGYMQGKDYEFNSYLVKMYDGKVSSIKSLVTKGQVNDETFTTTSFASYYDNNGVLNRHITGIRESDKAPIRKSQKEMFSYTDGKISQYTKDTKYTVVGDVFVGVTNSFRKNGYVLVAEDTRY